MSGVLGHPCSWRPPAWLSAPSTGCHCYAPYVSYLMVMILSRVEHASILFLLQRVSPIVHLGGGSTCHSAWGHFQKFLRARMLEAMSSDGEDR